MSQTSVGRTGYEVVKPPDIESDDESSITVKKTRSFNKDTKLIWNLCINTVKKSEITSKKSDTSLISEKGISHAETTVLVVGAKSSGKTSIILRFLDREEPPKPTTALDYTFGRRTQGHNMNKDVTHMWELGGGVALSGLLEVPINEQCIRSLSTVIVVDLSRPQSIWTTLETLINVIKNRVKKVIGTLKHSSPSEANMLVAESLAMYGPHHTDKDHLDIVPIPLVIIGSKYDEFQNFDSEKKKIITRTLRYVAHHFGAHLCYFSSKVESLVAKTRGLLGHLAFNTQLSKAVVTDHNKPVYILAGMDAVSQIGSPPSSGSRSILEQWKHLFLSTFPQEKEATKPTDPSLDVQYKEPIIDSMRAQKDEELARFKKQQERKQREEDRRKGLKG